MMATDKDSKDIISCPRAKSDMTPCVVRDGRVACANDGFCVGCGIDPADELKLLAERYVALKDDRNHD